MELLNNLDRIDLYWSEAGDFIIENGDIKDTSRNLGAGFIDEVERRIKSSMGDWKLDPTFGASINRFQGQSNNQKTWQEIHAVIAHALTKDLFVYPDSIEINIAPIDVDEIAIRVDFTKGLDILLGDELPTVKVVYNLESNEPYIMR